MTDVKILEQATATLNAISARAIRFQEARGGIVNLETELLQKYGLAKDI